MNTCDICLKEFKRRDNMLRHKKNKHGSLRKGDPMSASESELTETEISESDTDHDMSEGDEASDANTVDEEEDPWDSVVQKAFDQCQDQFERRVNELLRSNYISEEEARQRVYLDMRSTYRKAASGVFTDRMLWFHAIRKQPVYKAIQKTVKNFVELDDYSSEEAWKSAVGQRKYLFDTILTRYNPPDLIDGNEEARETDSEEPSAKKAKA